VQYEAHWGLKEAPFDNVPDPRFYYPSVQHEEGLRRLLYGIERRKGAIMLTGEIGCGKTLLSRTLIQHLQQERYDLAVVANPSFAVRDFLKEVLYQLGINPSSDKLASLHALNDRLMENLRNGKDTVLVVDEAQAITDVQVFEELRLLLNFQLNDRFLLTLVLLGQPELRRKLSALEQLTQRIAIRHHLIAFDLDAVEGYVDFRIQMAGAKRSLFTHDAIEAIHQASEGIPRNVNTLCDLALLIGFRERQDRVGSDLIEKAFRETQ